MAARNKKNNAATKRIDNIVINTASQAYIRNITDFSLLSIDEENQLADAIQNNDHDSESHRHAKAKLIKANLRLVIKLASEFLNRGVSKHDLIAEGNIGLMTAAEKFNPEKGAKFSTYGAWWIKQAMHRAVAEQSRTIRIPVQAVEKISRINKATKLLTHQLGRLPTDDELSDFLEMNRKTVIELKNTSLSSSSLNEMTVVGDNENGEVQNFIPDHTEPMPDKILSDAEALEQLAEFITKLPHRERKVLELRYGLSGNKLHTLEEIGLLIGCTRERVRQVQNCALKSLQNMHLDIKNNSDK